ncbi:riboflavin kinase [Biscogniauxia mediterranea]|nr:riboflavin kinase [Biscogniauxia mediterranea]
MSSSTSTSTTTTTTTAVTSPTTAAAAAAAPSSSSSSSAAPAPPPSSASSRPRILYPDSGPEPPFPLRMEGEVISGFGRGSKELGIPTANLPVDATQTPWIADARSGVYFGWASLALPASHPDSLPPSSSSSQRFQIYPMVMSIGYNPFYKNAVRSAEVHVLRRFGADFYGCPMRLLILGFVREERDYDGLDALVADIGVDCEVARRSLAREAWTPREGIVLETETEAGTGTGAGAEGNEQQIRGLQKGTLDGSWLVRE